MFGLFKNNNPKCPVDEVTRLWIEDSFIWLINQFGEQRFLDVKTLVPSETDFPLQFDGSEASVKLCSDIIATQMDILPEKVKIEFYTDQIIELGSEMGNVLATQQDENENYSAGMYMGKNDNGEFVVCIERRQLKEPEKLIATLAHEFAHIKILGEQRLDENDEYLTDLTTVFWGLGIFNANTSFNFTTSHSAWAYSSQGYFTQQQWGYALALFIYIRNEIAPAWLNYLNPNVKADVKKSMDYILANTDKVLV